MEPLDMSALIAAVPVVGVLAWGLKRALNVIDKKDVIIQQMANEKDVLTKTVIEMVTGMAIFLERNEQTLSEINEARKIELALKQENKS